MLDLAIELDENVVNGSPLIRLLVSGNLVANIGITETLGTLVLCVTSSHMVAGAHIGNFPEGDHSEIAKEIENYCKTLPGMNQQISIFDLSSILETKSRKN